MGQSKKQIGIKGKTLKSDIDRIEAELRMPIHDPVKKADLEYELARLKKRL